MASIIIFILLLSLSFLNAQKIADGETVDLNDLAVTFNVLKILMISFLLDR